MIGGHGADAPQEFCEFLAGGEQLGRRDATAKSARRLVDDVLRDDGLESGEMVEQEDLAVVEVAWMPPKDPIK